jgi:hypothetical protein
MVAVSHGVGARRGAPTKCVLHVPDDVPLDKIRRAQIDTMIR